MAVLLFLGFIVARTSAEILNVTCDYKAGYDQCVDYQTLEANLTSNSLRVVNGNFFCSCDERCAYFDDCCMDAKRSFYNHPERSPVCAHLPYSQISVYIIKSCSKDWTDNYIKEKCTNSNHPKNNAVRLGPNGEPDEHYAEQLIVLNKKTNLVYGNIFCAICNNDADDVTSFDIKIYCEKSSQNDTSRANNGTNLKKYTLEIPREGELYKCVVVQKDLTSHIVNNYSVRKCVKTISQCAQNWTQQSTKERCTNYTSVVTVRGVAYRNIDCAYCNNETSRISCEALNGRLDISKFTFADLFDFSDKKFALSGTRSQKCGALPGHLYNPVTKKCVLYGKPTIFEGHGSARSGIIVRNNGKSLITTLCKTIKIPSSGFVTLKDGVVFVNATSKYYKNGEYELTENELSVCYEDTVNTNSDAVASSAESLISLFCLLSSIICLSIHLYVYTTTSKLQTLPGRNLTSLSGTLLLAHCVYIMTVFVHTRTALCAIIGILTHYLYLTSICWMSVMSFDVWRVFGRRRPSSRTKSVFFAYSVFAWLVPLVVVLCSIIVQYCAGSNEYQPLYAKRCWISQKKSLLLFFVGPVGVMITFNAISFSVTLYQLIQTKKTTTIIRDRKNNVRLLLYLKLALIMGLTWSFGFLAGISNRNAIWVILFILFNSLQGVFIFFAFSFKRKVFATIRDKLSFSSSTNQTITTVM